MPTSEIKLPDLGENIAEGGVLEIKVKAGDAVKAGDVLLVIEAEKSTVEVTADGPGTIVKLLVEKGQTVKPGQAIVQIESGGAATPAAEPKKATAEPRKSAAPAAAEKTQPPATERNGDRNGERTAVAAQPRNSESQLVPAGPATRRLAGKLGVNLTLVPGTGPRGRVTQDDVIGFSRRSGALAPMGGASAPTLPDFTKWGEIEERPMEMIRRKTAEQMALAWSQIPHVTQNDQADVTELEAFRRSQDGKGPKLTVTAFVLKASAVALREYPHFNSSLDVPGNRVIVKKYVHIGVAVDTDRGLIVPVIRNVDQKSVRELANELTEVAERARQRKLPVEDLRGGTFTITNLGGIGGTTFTPIVNWPETAIIGLSRARMEPVYRDNQFVPRLMLPLSLSYDHRVIDGADGARFVRRIAAMLENPLVMLLEA